jgi:hypothetical protein
MVWECGKSRFTACDEVQRGVALVDDLIVPPLEEIAELLRPGQAHLRHLPAFGQGAVQGSGAEV